MSENQRVVGRLLNWCELNYLLLDISKDKGENKKDRWWELFINFCLSGRAKVSFELD